MDRTERPPRQLVGLTAARPAGTTVGLTLGLSVALLCLCGSTALGRTPTPRDIPLGTHAPKEVFTPTYQPDGLCASYRVIGAMDQPIFFFDELGFMDPTQLYRRVNSFVDAGGTDPRRVDFSLALPMDFTNGFDNGTINAKGDFIGVACGDGCPFPPAGFVGTDTFFATRYRGFLNVPQGWVGRQLYIGLTSDDAAYVSLFDQEGKDDPLLMMTTGPRAGIEGLRIVNQVVFPRAGLYPMEIGYAQLRAAAYLEVALYRGDQPLADKFKQPTLDNLADPPQFWYEQKIFDITTKDAPKLSDWPNPQTDATRHLLTPSLFYQSRSSQHPTTKAEVCRQCPRMLVGQSGAPTGCERGFFCNEAAICDLCHTAKHCGPNCEECSGATPVCDGEKCVPCVNSGDCPVGNTCDKNQCVPCASDNACSGNSCNCCPGDTHCLETSQKGRYVCGRCRGDTDCAPEQRCEPDTLRCVQRTANVCAKDPNGKTDACGADCAACPEGRPHCLDGSVCVQCRADDECALGNYCNSGDCLSCTTERRCGTRCLSCTAAVPFCYAPSGKSDTARCVECLTDANCGPGGKCRQDSLTCEKPCEACKSGGGGGTVCLDTKCVECATDVQCPCGQHCDRATNKCDPGCANSQDCLGSECCNRQSKTCVPGRCKPGTGVLCCDVGRCGQEAEDATADPHAPSAAPGVKLALGTALLTFALLLRGRRRTRRRG